MEALIRREDEGERKQEGWKRKPRRPYVYEKKVMRIRKDYTKRLQR